MKIDISHRDYDGDIQFGTVEVINGAPFNEADAIIEKAAKEYKKICGPTYIFLDKSEQFMDYLLTNYSDMFVRAAPNEQSILCF
jgi:hypothetical protein